MDIDSIKNKIYLQGRDLEVAIYNTLFEGDDKEMVTYALSLFQNSDGGFGHGLEPDSLNPNSSPFQTSYALELLIEVGYTANNLDDFTKDLVKKTVKYLKKTIVSGNWPLTIPSNNDHACAIWWKYDPDKRDLYNPTASILGSLLILLDNKHKDFYFFLETGMDLMNTFLKDNVTDKHALNCLIYLFKGLSEHVDSDKLSSFKQKLDFDIQKSISAISDWEGYATMPYDYLVEKNQYGISKDIMEKSVEYLNSIRKVNYWDTTWTWFNEDPGFDIQQIKWQAILTIKYLLFLREHQK